MKKISLFTGMFLMVASMSFAALSPYFQRVNELQAILNEHGIAAAIQGDTRSSGLIDKVEYVDFSPNNFQYRITSGRCTLGVTLVFESNPKVIGPAEFKIFWDKKLTCN